MINSIQNLDNQSAEELSSMVLTKMRQTAEQYLGKKVKYVETDVGFIFGLINQLFRLLL